MTDTVFHPPAPPAAGQRQRWYALPGLSSAIACYELLRREQRFGLLIASDASQAQQWYQALRLLAKDSVSDKGSSNDKNSASNTAQHLPLWLFPDHEVLPYDHFSPHPDIISERLACLFALQQAKHGICIVTAYSLLNRLSPKSHLNRYSLLLAVGQRQAPEKLIEQLISAGYQRMNTVYQHGEFTARGSLLDIYPTGSELPYRIDFFDDEISSIRPFDPESQRSLDKIEQVTALPAGEIAFDDDAINRFRDQWHLEFSADPDNCPIYRDTVDGLSPAGIEAYLPMFFDATANITDYLPNDTVVFTSGSLTDSLETRWQAIEKRFEEQAIDPRRPLLRPHRLFFAVEEIQQRLKQYSRIDTSDTSGVNNPARGEHTFDCRPAPVATIDSHSDKPFEQLEHLLDHTESKILLCFETSGRREVYYERLKPLLDKRHKIATVDSWKSFRDSEQALSLCVAAITQGAEIPQHQLIILSESDFLGEQAKPRHRLQRQRENIAADAIIKNLTELKVGSPVVHVEHGIGRYTGLQNIEVDGVDNEFLTLEYGGNDKLYVPVTSLHLISRYVGGNDDSPPLHKLGNERWSNLKRRAAEKVRDVAAELLDLNAQRAARDGFAFTITNDMQRFENSFPFEETPDQLQAIEAVKADMAAARPMDRLICGDVGFGKTEVAMRAAFIAAQNCKQTLVLVPTTLLAQQHYQNFRDRFADWPIRIDTLSRFRTAKEQETVMQQFEQGDVDILVGTHKLLQKTLQAKDLGLIIVDEEHRFGVRQKEQLKALKADVDLLNMTATPIPRTLNMAMAGMRDLSIIATPPARRLSIKTFVQERQDSITKEAILRELLRGGQVFYLHNDVDSIAKAADELQQLVPEARIAIGHGQMRERELEQVMTDFYHKKHNILVCTTIVETGIDIPNANTIIINRADKFGLAQLHQLRGRVGRSHHQAYAYLLIPNRKLLTSDAEKRLLAIEESQDLGSGFVLATHDLEIRGAGELLGEEQSGQIHSIGFNLYMDMLEKATAAVKNGSDLDLDRAFDIASEINLHVSALIPDDYLPDVQLRLQLYKRIASCDSSEALRELQVEMIDRFGLLSDPIRQLFMLSDMRLQMEDLGLVKLDVSTGGGYVEFSNNTRVEPLTIVKMVQNDPQTFRLSGASRLAFNAILEESDERLAFAKDLLNQFVQATQTNLNDAAHA